MTETVEVTLADVPALIRPPQEDIDARPSFVAPNSATVDLLQKWLCDKLTRLAGGYQAAMARS